MVRYTGRAKTRTGSVNTNQLGLKMSGCTSRIGHTMVPMKLVPSRVDCMAGACNPIRYHGVLWGRGGLRNQRPYCRPHATKCQAAAGGVGTKHNIPYYRIPKRGESGCTPAAVNTDGIHLLTAAAITTHPDPSSMVEQVGFIAQDPIYDAHGGSLEPSSYKGVNIIALSTNTTLNQLGILTAGGTPPPFSSITFSGGDLPAAYSFSVSDALHSPFDPTGPVGGYYFYLFSSPFLFTAGQTYRVTFS